MRLVRSSFRAVLGKAARLLTPLLLVLGLAAAALAGALGSAAATGQSAMPARESLAQVPVNFDVSERPGNDVEDTIAANPTDPRNVAAMDCTAGRKNVGGLFLGVSFDGGRAWTRRLFATGAAIGHTCDERLALDRYGNLWMTHLTARGDVFVGVSTDGGRRVRKVTDILPTGPKPSPASMVGPAAGALSGRPDRYLGIVADQPFVAVGPGSVWVSYTSTPSGVIQAAGVRVTGRGRFGRFTAPQSVPTRQGDGDWGNIAVGPRGQVLVTYENVAGSCCSRIYTALDPDGLGPAGFGRPQLLARTRVQEHDLIPAQPDRGINADPMLAWDTGGGRYHGRVYAVWTQATRRNRDNLNVMFQYSQNSGRTWTKAIPLNDSHTVNSQFLPTIAVDPATGDIAAGWYDCRNARSQGGHGCRRPDSYVQFWATYSTDGGADFAPDFQVSQGTSSATDAHGFFDYGDYAQAAFQSHLFYPAWSDNSDSTGTNPNSRLHQLDLYTAPVRIP